MNRSIKILILSILTFGILILILYSIYNLNINKTESKKEITIITTLFPTYDFTKNIAGNTADILLLISPGTESHSYEPSINDISKISASTLFIYTGENLEPWTSKITKSDFKDLNLVNVSNGIKLLENMDDDQDEHEHLDFDPHIWMDIKNAKIMCKNIYDALCNISEKNKELYTKNYNEYIEKLDILEKKYNSLVGSNKKLVFASPFAYRYMTEAYNLDYISAYGFCSEESEPSAIDIKNIIEYMNKNSEKYVICDKMFSKNTALTICNETNANILDFNSVHNISKTDLENGTGYIELMTENLSTLSTIFN